MPNESKPTGNAHKLFFCWIVVGIPLLWGVYKTLLQLPALFR